MGHTKAISAVAKKYRWGIFYLCPDNVFPKAVKEFYAHITSPNNAFIYVHDASILFDADSINAQYGLSEGPYEHVDFVKTMSPERLAQVFTDVCVEVKVPLSSNEDHLPNKGAITKLIVQKISGEEMPMQTSTPPSSPPKTTSAPSTSHTEFEW
ncbi:hypothetical protein PVK06_011906 [Gossypium arboreum]|uniref:Uncharacterized protein n=1 Tax=Gossypium arboreum TaxID=29729 RepID=A0ABR0QAI7_GOSAR|nr:hypothetical protein PVK06_011906 [Gossypium arboreum]